MAHGDDNGLVLPPALAPIEVVMVPIYKTAEEHAAILEKMNQIKSALQAAGHTAKIDDRDTLRPGFKFAEWELKGVPVRLAIGARDLQNDTVEVHRRDTLEKNTVSLEGIDNILRSFSLISRRISTRRLSTSVRAASRNAILGRSSRRRSLRANSFSAIGTALPRPSRRSRMRRRLLSDASLWTLSFARRKVWISIPESLHTRESCSRLLTNPGPRTAPHFFC